MSSGDNKFRQTTASRDAYTLGLDNSTGDTIIGTHSKYPHTTFRNGGNVELADGDVKFASGHGINFSATADGTGTANRSETLDGDSRRKKVMKDGMRNSNVMAIAPTATISNITGVTQSIEPTYQNLYVKSNLSGEFTIVNPHLVRKLKELDLWDDVMINDLKYFEGSLTEISRIPDDIKKLFSTAFEVEPRYIVESASRRQKWIDQAQSLNLYIGNADGKKLDITYRMAWYSGLKTTYYLRSIAATSTEKSTVQQGKLNAVSSDANQTSNQELGAPAPVADACSLDDPDCEACQ